MLKRKSLLVKDEPVRKRPRTGRLQATWSFVVRETASVIAKLASFAGILAFLFLLLFDGREVVLRDIDPEVKARVAGLLGIDTLEIGSIGFSLGSGDTPAGLTLNDVTIAQAEDGPNLRVPRLETAFSVMEGMQGRLRPQKLEIGGTALALARGADGAISLSADGTGEGGVTFFRPGGTGGGFDIQGALNGLRRLDDQAMLSELRDLRLDDVSFRFTDAASGRSWDSQGATARLSRQGGAVSASIDAKFAGDSGNFEVRAGFQRAATDAETRAWIEFRDARPADLAALFKPLAWMGIIDAPVSGALAATVDGNGTVVSLFGNLSVASGVVGPVSGLTVPFDGGSSYFSYDAAADLFRVDFVGFESRILTVEAAGEVLVERDTAGAIGALVADVTLDSVGLDLPEFFSRRLAFDEGTAAVRISFAPLAVEIGAVRLANERGSAGVSGDIAIRDGKWDIALDAEVERMPVADALALWPEAVRRGLRRWIVNHIEDGRLTRFQANLRQWGEAREIALEFGFEDAVARPLEHMPPIVGARGSGRMIAGRFDLFLDEGRTGPGQGEGIDLAGSHFQVADTLVDPAVADIAIQGRGPIPALLRLIDNPPLRFLERAGQTPALADGTGAVAALISVPLKDGLTGADVGAEVAATLTDVRSDTAVPGRAFAADSLELRATGELLTVAGQGTLSGVPVDFTFRRPLDKASDGRATVAGTVAVTADTASALGIPLPQGSLGGQGVGRFDIALSPDGPPEYRMDVGLAGAALRIAPLGWRKPAGPAARLSLSGALGDAPTVRRIALDGPGLALEGSLTFGAGGLTGADFDRLRLGNWFDAPLTWRPRTGQPDSVRIAGGRVDLRNGPQLGDGAGAIEAEFRNTRVVVSDSIALTGTTGSATFAGGANRGRFAGRVNGNTPIEGVLRADGDIFVSGADAGAALRDAGIFRNALGGELRARFSPAAEGLSGAFSIRGARVVRASTLAELLTVASVVGLADRLNGPGIGFDDIQGSFRIRGNRILLDRARAVGPSLGVTLRGDYDTVRERLDMSGVVSPIYFLNGALQRIPILGTVLGGRPGEGLLGATFTLKGSAADPAISVNPLSLLTPGVAREIFQPAAETE